MKRISVNTFTANIQREWLARIIAGSKKIEYRRATGYWLGRLDRAGPPPFYLRLINGMKSDSPEALVTVDEVDIELLSAEIRLHLGQVVSTLRWKNQWNAQYPARPSEIVVPETPFASGDPSITLEGSPSLIEGLRSPGPHAFDLPTDEPLARKLCECGPDPFFIRVRTSTAQATVLVYQIYWQYFEDQARFLVLTPGGPPGRAS